MQAEHPPVGVGAVAGPVQRRPPAVPLSGGPPVGEPELGPGVAAVRDEFVKLAAGHGAGSEFERGDVGVVPRPLVVEREPRPVVPDPPEPRLVVFPLQRGRVAARRVRGRGVPRAERVEPEGVFEVRQQKLLVLLLVVQAEFEERGDRGDCSLAGSLQQGEHPLVDHPAVGVHLGDGRPRQEPAGRPRPPVADRVVVRVEQKAVERVERPKVRRVGREDERLEEPGGVCQVPLRRTAVGHRLELIVLRLEWRAQPLRASADSAVAGVECRPCDGYRLVGHLISVADGLDVSKMEANGPRLSPQDLVESHSVPW